MNERAADFDAIKVLLMFQKLVFVSVWYLEAELFPELGDHWLRLMDSIFEVCGGGKPEDGMWDVLLINSKEDERSDQIRAVNISRQTGPGISAGAGGRGDPWDGAGLDGPGAAGGEWVCQNKYCCLLKLYPKQMLTSESWISCESSAVLPDKVMVFQPKSHVKTARSREKKVN